MTRFGLGPLVALLLVIGGCQNKSRSAEIIAKLEKQGLRVEAGIARPNEYGWEANMELILDGQRGYHAVQFGSTKGSQDYCRTARGVVVDYWCITTHQPQTDPIWQKVQKIGGRFSF